ncbi:hypothetical protein F4782DRAFT_502173 [Xylaria castorea]|nr:hypothetical protein F4782DRAFT_502173 [Xylaria castorea]
MFEAFPSMLDAMPAGARLTLSFDTSAQTTTPSQAITLGNKRNLASEEDRDSAPKPKKQKLVPKDPEVIDPKACGNCGAQNHRAAFCVKTGRSGWMEACPKCDSTKHVYEACPQRKKGAEDFVYLVYNRQRKPPVKSTMKLGKLIKNELARTGTKWHRSEAMELPYSAVFARQEARQNPPEAWTYANVGDPTEEAKGRTPEPSRTYISLIDAAMNTSLAEQAWSQEQERFDPPQDGEMPIVRLLRNPQSNRDSRPLRDFAPVRKYNLSAIAYSARKWNEDLYFPCDNCGQMGHRIRECPGRCAACGERDHNIQICEQRLQACVCEKIPFHLLKNCKIQCEYCVIVENNNDPHYARDCPALCHYCLKTGHKMGDCPDERSILRGCLSCLGKAKDEPLFHLPSQCVGNWCCHTDCKDRLGCERHCEQCGWSWELAHLQLSGIYRDTQDGHVCQFTKAWDYTTQVPEIKMRCLRSNHILKHRDLVELRAIMLEETEALCETECEVKPWLSECPECRADMEKAATK